MNHISSWVVRLNSLRSWCPDPLNLLEELGPSAELCRAASKEGFARLRANSDKDYDWETWSTEWWISQALKKFRGESNIRREDRARQAVSGFLDRNNAARSIRLPWHIRARARELLERALPCPDEFADGHFGPGAIAERLDSLQRWKLLETFRLHPRTGAWQGPRDAIWNAGPDGVARLVAVPKDTLRDRLITVEPGEHSFWQQSLRDSLLMSVHSGPLRGTVMDMIVGGLPEDRQRNRCQYGSLRRHTTTLDLEDASDRISYVNVASIFPSWVLYLVDLSRTTRFSTPGGEIFDLYMYGGMGNASTFMIETLYFWAVITAICERLRSFGLVTVFGDDIIVPSSAAQHPLFEDYCSECGIVLNRTKSVLTDSSFREACGWACLNGMHLLDLISIKGPFDNTDVGKMNLAGLITRLSFSPLHIHQFLARQLYDDSDLPCIRWNRPIDDIEAIVSDWLPCRGNITSTWDKAYQRWYVRCKSCMPMTRRYTFSNLGNEIALGVLRGQLKADTVRAHGVGKTVISIDLPHRKRTRPRKIYLPW